ncbi:hypothetical protein D3C79_338990 [compost metagenome]
MAGARVQVQLKAAILLGTPGFQLHRLADFRDAVAAALFAGGDGNLLPLLNFFRQAFAGKRNAATLGKQRGNDVDPQLDGFLNGELHFLTARNYLTQMQIER